MSILNQLAQELAALSGPKGTEGFSAPSDTDNRTIDVYVNRGNVWGDPCYIVDKDGALDLGTDRGQGQNKAQVRVPGVTDDGRVKFEGTLRGVRVTPHTNPETKQPYAKLRLDFTEYGFTSGLDSIFSAQVVAALAKAVADGGAGVLRQPVTIVMKNADTQTGNGVFADVVVGGQQVFLGKGYDAKAEVYPNVDALLVALGQDEDAEALRTTGYTKQKQQDDAPQQKAQKGQRGKGQRQAAPPRAPQAPAPAPPQPAMQPAQTAGGYPPPSFTPPQG